MKKLLLLVFSSVLLLSCTLLGLEETEEDKVDTDTVEETVVVNSLSIQVSLFRNVVTLASPPDLSDLDFAIILTQTSAPADIITEVDNSQGYLQSGILFEGSSDEYNGPLSFVFEDITSGDYFLAFLIDYDNSGSYEYYSNDAESSEIIVFGEYIDDPDGYEQVLPSSANVHIEEEEQQYLYFSLDSEFISTFGGQ